MVEKLFKMPTTSANGTSEENGSQGRVASGGVGGGGVAKLSQTLSKLRIGGGAGGGGGGAKAKEPKQKQQSVRQRQEQQQQQQQEQQLQQQQQQQQQQLSPEQIQLPQVFTVKSLGKRPARGLWGIKHTRKPVDDMVAAAR